MDNAYRIEIDHALEGIAVIEKHLGSVISWLPNPGFVAQIERELLLRHNPLRRYFVCASSSDSLLPLRDWNRILRKQRYVS
ncbi:hypothetical protein [Bradyrhizobium sp. CCGB01]|uniref:hypothetical protein n=1 Tax=Bradyrhizobium sp. CCGB01 TaxID=2949634 RepID=UPI0020B2D09D|nr:hypothetical protein [Bradyrhizobium sp. CCGB01]MCP3411339.1 hypothetical protein [Bradyrhizobium sp. CCGB01]